MDTKGQEDQRFQSPPPYTQPPPAFTYNQQPPPASPYNQQPQPQVVQTQVVYAQAPVFGKECVNTTCRSCGAQITTTTREETGVVAYVIAAVTCALGIWCGCCLIPLCMDSLRDVTHYCPNCNAIQGKYKAKL